MGATCNATNNPVQVLCQFTNINEQFRELFAIEQRFQDGQPGISPCGAMIAIRFVKVLATDQAKAFTGRTAQWTDGHFQKHVFSNQGGKVNMTIFRQNQVRIGNRALSEGVQLSKINPQ